MSALSAPLTSAKYESLEVAEAITDSAEDDSQMEVVAPATLMAGYELLVNVNGKNVTVVVPAGGVVEGQKFRGVVMSLDKGGCSHNAPVGRWRDGLCDCCKHGCCHHLVWMTWCCMPVVLAQVLYRMRLDWCGRPSTRKNSDSAFAVIVGGYFAFFLVRLFLSYYMTTQAIANALADPTNPPSMLFVNIQNLLDIFFGVYILVLMCRARHYVRNKYSIPNKCCGELEDCCCSYWCGCCSVGQMARHTADYQVYAGSCCSKSGMPPHVPEIV